MVSRGHSLHDLTHTYPISTLRCLMKAAQYNKKEALASYTQGVSAAVLNGLDAGWNKGKGQIMKKFLNNLFKEEKKKNSKPEDFEKDLFAIFRPRNQNHPRVQRKHQQKT